MRLITYSGFPAKLRAKRGILRRDADGACVEVAYAHHHAADGDQRQRRKPELLSTEQCCDGNIPPRHQFAVGFYAHPAPKSVGNQRLVRFCKPQFPGKPRVLDARARASARSAVVSGYEISRPRRPWRRQPQWCRRQFPKRA